MKRLTHFIICAFLLCLIPFSITSGQEKKDKENSERKIKIVVSDDSGTKVVLDTLLNDGNVSDSIRLKDGNVVYIGTPGDNDDNKKFTEVTVVSSDSAAGDDGRTFNKTYIVHKSGEPADVIRERHKVITRNENEGDAHVKKVIVIRDGDENGDVHGRTYKYTIDSDKQPSDGERAKYVITRNGMKITVEGDDYAKVKEMVKEIETSMDKKHAANKQAPKAKAGKK